MSDQRAAWDIALAEYQNAATRMNADDEGAVEMFIDAETAILDARVPDLDAFRWKLERMREIADHSAIEAKDFDRLIADIANLD